MRSARILLLLLVALPAAATERFHILHVPDLVRVLAAGNVFLYDANVESTREHVGSIPGARLLASSHDYDVDATLPADHACTLVFYCANTYCTASHEAATRALDGGYTNVSVMVDGIYGWRNAGQAVRKLAPAPHALAPREVQDLLDKSAAVVVDVREDEERHEIVDKALSMPMSKSRDPKAWERFASGLPKNKTIVFYCAAGVRAKKSAERLRADGFSTGYFDGPDQWKAAGLPLKPGPAR